MYVREIQLNEVCFMHLFTTFTLMQLRCSQAAPSSSPPSTQARDQKIPISRTLSLHSIYLIFLYLHMEQVALSDKSDTPTHTHATPMIQVHSDTYDTQDRRQPAEQNKAILHSNCNNNSITSRGNDKRYTFLFFPLLSVSTTCHCLNR